MKLNISDRYTNCPEEYKRNKDYENNLVPAPESSLIRLISRAQERLRDSEKKIETVPNFPPSSNNAFPSSSNQEAVPVYEESL